MTLFKKSFIGIFILFLFMFGLTLIPREKVGAAVVVDVRADNTSVLSGGSTTIRWTSSGAISCTRTDTGATLSTEGSFDTGPLFANKTFTISCADAASTPGSCSGTYVSRPSLCLKGGMYYPLNYSCGTNCCSRSTASDAASACFTSSWSPITTPTCSSSCVCSGTTVSQLTSSCTPLGYTACTTAPRSTGSPHCTWTPS